MRVFLLGLNVLSVINKKEEITSDTFLVTDSEAEEIQTAINRNAYFWKDEEGLLHYSSEAPSDYYEWNDETKQWILNEEKFKENLEAHQTELWSKVKEYRVKILTAGTKVGDYWFHTDEISQLSYTRAKEYFDLNPTETVKWKTMTSEYVTVGKDMMSEIISGIFLFGQEVFKTAETHYYKIMKLEKIEDYDYKTGWPETYLEVNE